MSRMLCTEALEGRWLLSVAVPFAGAPLSGDSGSVHVVASDVQEEEEGEETEVEPSDLPPAVVAALHAKFGGDVEILEAQLEEEDGSEYGITAKSGGKDYDITLSPSGSILEVEELLTEDQLPAALREWLAIHHPGAVIEEAAVITSGSEREYELTFAEPGRQAVETTFTIDPVVAAAPSVSNDAVSFSDATVPDLPVFAATAPAAAPAAPEEPSTRDEASDDIETQNTAAAEAAASLPAWVAESGQARVAEALAALAAGAGAAAWLPEVADVLSEVLPFDIASVEESLKQFLAEIDAMATQALADTTPGGAGLRLSIVVSLIAGVQLLLLDRRLRKGGPVVVFGAPRKSWSWVLGTTMPVKVKVRRTNVFRG